MQLALIISLQSDKLRQTWEGDTDSALLLNAQQCKRGNSAVLTVLQL